jgi:hypothetical protein
LLVILSALVATALELMIQIFNFGGIPEIRFYRSSQNIVATVLITTQDCPDF